MNWLSKLLSILPIAVDVAGRKTRTVLALGDAFVPVKEGEPFDFSGEPMLVQSNSIFRLWKYAQHNVERTYSESDFGIYLRSCADKGASFVDIGANIGGYAAMGMDLGLATVAVEANPDLSANLQSNASIFGEVHAVALSDKAGSMPFHISKTNPGGSSLVESNQGWEHSGYSHSINVEVSTFDLLLGDRERFDIVKIDVEGAELSVVRGMQKSLAAGKVKAIWCEVRGPDSDRNPGSCAAVSEFLSTFGFKPHTFVYKASEQGVFLPFDLNAPQAQFFDLIYFKDEPRFIDYPGPSRPEVE